MKVAILLLNKALGKNVDCSQLRILLHSHLSLLLLRNWFLAHELIASPYLAWRTRLKLRKGTQQAFSTAYANLLLLEERIAGRQEAFEGIRIVRERIKEES
jgi:hypothetical protein